MIERIHTPADLKGLTQDELCSLADEIRGKILEAVSKNGGHLASNLGTVELEIALHTVFDCPHDKIVFDVGHQCYTHKLLTGRADDFGSLRKFGGISGFTNRDESEYDTVTAGHSGSSLSAALGIAEAAALSGDASHTVAVIGDGSFTNGMIYEALNNCSSAPPHLVIVLNDNGMSISQNVGGLSAYFSRIRTSERYFSFKVFMKKYFVRIPLIGRGIVSAARRIKNAVKRLLLSDNIFESLGLEYLGPVDGNDMKKVISVLREAKSREECTIVHIKTKKGLGYLPSEAFPDKYHSAPPFELDTGFFGPSSTLSFTSSVSDELCAVAETDSKVCAVCAAMPDGCGLTGFAELFPDRFFDVGIAEEHAVAFCGGLSISGFRPILVMYSTFAQRVFDQIFHDIALQRCPLTFLLSHAGLVPGDGVTHQGIYDVALLSPIPGVRIYAPDSYSELKALIGASVLSNSIDVIRYPKGSELSYDRSSFSRIGDVFANVPKDPDAVIVTYGRLTRTALHAAAKCSCTAGVIRVLRISPLPTDDVISALGSAAVVYILEEGIRRGGFGEALEAALKERGMTCRTVVHAIDDGIIPHGDLESLMHLCGFEPNVIASRIESAAENPPS